MSRLLQKTIQTNLKRMKNFLGFAKSYLIRKNPVKAFINDMIATFKDMLSINKKRKLAKYRLNYQMYKLNQMEKLIVANNEHVFLRGNKFNEMR